MKFSSLAIEGAFVVDLTAVEDARGCFVKLFNEQMFLESPIDEELQFKEDFYTRSKPRVLRGLHFQMPPFAQAKLVTCLQGSVLDVGLDLRKGSKTFGKMFELSLSEDQPKAVFLPRGVAHGFYVTSHTDALISYKVTQGYHRDSDTGVLWSSCHFYWPELDPIVSERDMRFPTLAAYGEGIDF